MKVLGINLRPDATHIVEGKLQKGSLIIEKVDITDSIYRILETFQEESVEYFFVELLRRIKNKKAAAYLGICDQLVKKIDCGERDYILPGEWENSISDWLAQFLQMEKDKFYFSVPLCLEKANKNVITGMATPAIYIDLIFKSATAAGFKIKSIEPACYGLLRILNEWDKECCIMEVWEKNTSITGYSPIRGMFKLSKSVGWSYYLQEITGKSELLKSIATHDYTAYTTYKLANTNIPIYLVSDKIQELSGLLLNSEISARVESLSDIPQEFIKSKQEPAKLIPYGTALGLALAPLHERMVENANPSG